MHKNNENRNTSLKVGIVSGLQKSSSMICDSFRFHSTMSRAWSMADKKSNHCGRSLQTRLDRKCPRWPSNLPH